MKSLILILIFAFLCIPILQAQISITRGAQADEIYLSTDWYADCNDDIHYAIFYSNDNGETISLQYENIETPLPGEMKVGRVLGDATPGVLYNYGWNELWVSYNYGENWAFVENYAYSGFYTSGSIAEEMFKNGTDVAGTLYYSDDYGISFTKKNEDIKFLLEVGIMNGELYGRGGLPGVGYNLYFSTNYGETFTSKPIDSAVAFWQVSGYYPQISRGTEPGELYLVSWWPDYHYKIFHSVDTGYTWTEMYESDYIDVYSWRLKYTAGREPGSFYVLRNTPAPPLDHIWLYIDYSSDYGETFTTYFHDLDSTIVSVNSLMDRNFKLTNHPNPFSVHTSFRFSLPDAISNAILNIYDLKGNLIRQFDINGKQLQVWDGSDQSGNKVNSGLYLYQIQSDKSYSSVHKLLFIK